MNRSRPIRILPLLLLLLLVPMLVLTSRLSTPALAAPLPALTQTGEPPTPTRTPTATPTRAAAQATAVPLIADPAVTVAISAPAAAVGDEIAVTIRVTNLGNRLAQGVIVEQGLPAYLEVLSLTIERGQVVADGSTVGCWVGDVAPGEVILCTIVVRVTAVPPMVQEWFGAQLFSAESTDLPDNNQSQPIVSFSGDLQPTATPTLTPLPETPRMLPNTAASSPGFPVTLLLLGLALVAVLRRLLRTDVAARR